MKKFFAILLSLALMLPLAACEDKKSLQIFDTDATIEETVIYDENDVKITANELTYGSFSAELSLTVENKSDQELSFFSGSADAGNSVNGYMVENAFFDCDVPAGQSETDTISFDFNSLNVYGINSIADIELSFRITDEDYERTYTGPVQIKTSLAKSYDYSVNRYQNVMSNGALENKFGCVIDCFSKDNLYDNNGIRIVSSAVITNVDGDSSLLLEMENNTKGTACIGIEEIYLNNCLVYESRAAGYDINANKKCIAYMSLSDLADEYEGDFADVSNISNISFKLSVGEDWYKPVDTKKINIDLPNIEIKATEE